MNACTLGVMKFCPVDTHCSGINLGFLLSWGGGGGVDLDGSLFLAVGSWIFFLLVLYHGEGLGGNFIGWGGGGGGGGGELPPFLMAGYSSIDIFTMTLSSNFAC